jgi:serine/threonine protein kinase/Flp pilus assembly protein TadD
MSDTSKTETHAPGEHPEGPGTHIGPYRILQQIGEGGFGVVFEADQEQPVKRRVALKILKLGMDTHQVVARFQAERQALAMMEHPHIAQVLDAGATSAGRPYFVMELVKGESITRYCDAHRLTVVDRLRLFDQVCVAVQHAHTKGIIHRDLKPNNVLVSTHDDRPFAKVIDFGVAKATGHRLSNETLYTARHEVIGTPLYMSPEQVQGSTDVDTRTDIYSLGVILYELLTGTTPIDPATIRAGIPEIQRVVCEVDPPRPSTRLSHSGSILTEIAARRRTHPRALTAIFKGDLDWIVLKAIDKDRVRRYDTANAFAMDLRRYLVGEPVLAAPPGTTYRMRKFVHRHKAAVAATFLVAVALVLGIIGTTVGLVRAERERRAADKVAEFMTDILEGVGPQVARGRDTAMMKEMMSMAAKRIEGGELRDALEAELELRWSIGTTQTLLAEFDAAERLLAPALDMARGHFGAQDLRFAAGLDALGSLRREQGRYQEAEALKREALRIRRARLDPKSVWLAHDLASLAAVLTFENKLTEAEAAFRESLDLYRSLRLTERRYYSTALSDYGVLLRRAGRFGEAEAAYREALEITRQRAHGEPDPDVATLLTNLAVVQKRQGKVAEAETAARESLAMMRTIHGAEHTAIAGGLNALAAALVEQGKYAEAEHALREALSMLRKLVGNDHQYVARTLASLASALHGQGKSSEAEPLARDAVTIADRALPGSEEAARFRVSLGRILMSLDRLPQAESVLLEADRIQRVGRGILPDRREECVRALITMYSSREKASPGQGYGARANEWSKRLEELTAANSTPGAEK